MVLCCVAARFGAVATFLRRRNAAAALNQANSLPCVFLVAKETAGKILPPLGPIMPWGPTIDGTQTALPDLPLTLIEKGQFNKVPAIFGTNKDEGTIFVPALPLIVKGTHFPPTPDDLTQGMERTHSGIFVHGFPGVMPVCISCACVSILVNLGAC